MEIEGNKIQHVTILQGIPASGKSTFARREALANPDKVVIISRDSIRSSLGKYWVPSREKLVTEIEHHTIYEALKQGYNIILDSTNLNPHFLKDIETLILKFQNKNKGISIMVHKRFFHVPLQTAIWRDRWRGLFGGRKVGKKVIEHFYERYIKDTL